METLRAPPLNLDVPPLLLKTLSSVSISVRLRYCYLTIGLDACRTRLLSYSYRCLPGCRGPPGLDLCKNSLLSPACAPCMMLLFSRGDPLRQRPTPPASLYQTWLWRGWSGNPPCLALCRLVSAGGGSDPGDLLASEAAPLRL